MVNENYIPRGNRPPIDLGDGYVAYLVWSRDGNEPVRTYEIYDGDEKFAQSGKIAELCLYYYKDLDRWTIGTTNIDDKHRGKGLVRRLIKTLTKTYPRLGSDPQGNTSNDAHKMWKALGAKQSPTSLNTKGYYHTFGETMKTKQIILKLVEGLFRPGDKIFVKPGNYVDKIVPVGDDKTGSSEFEVKAITPATVTEVRRGCFCSYGVTIRGGKKLWVSAEDITEV